MLKYLFPNTDHKVKVIDLKIYIQEFAKMIDGQIISGTIREEERTKIIIEIVEPCSSATKIFTSGKRFYIIESSSIISFKMKEEFVTDLKGWIPY